MFPPVLPFQESEVEVFEESTKKQIKEREGKICKIDVLRMRGQTSAPVCLSDPVLIAEPTPKDTT
jgi:hypothetical protein